MYSLCDTDLYTLTMQQLVFHRYSSTEVTYKFKWRNWDKCRDILGRSMDMFVDELNEQIDDLCALKFTKGELHYLSGMPYLKPTFIDYLRIFKLNRNHIVVEKTKDITKEPFLLEIKGPWLSTIPFGTPVLALISGLFTSLVYTNVWQQAATRRLLNKINFVKSSVARLKKRTPFQFTDFCTRRRASEEWHNELIGILVDKCPDLFTGTSNVKLARDYGINAVGTMAHELFQAHQQMDGKLINSQSATLQAWIDEYQGDLGIALSDIMGFDAFLVDFNKYFSSVFDGCRHDSGDPVKWGWKLLDHYGKLNICPLTKIAGFSDSLDFPAAIHLWDTFGDRINTNFGIGTNLGNDIGFIAPQIVIKMTECNGGPVAKVSDSEGKGMCEDPEFSSYLKKIIAQKIKNAII